MASRQAGSQFEYPDVSQDIRDLKRLLTSSSDSPLVDAASNLGPDSGSQFEYPNVSQDIHDLKRLLTSSNDPPLVDATSNLKSESDPDSQFKYPAFSEDIRKSGVHLNRDLVSI